MNFLHNIWLILHELAPWLLLGVVVSVLTHKFLPTGFVSKHLRGYSGIAKSVLFGIPLPLCSCGVIPAGIGLKRDGSSDGSAIGFLISTPQTGVDSILVSASFLGWPFALFKVAAAGITGFLGGGLVEWLQPTQEASNLAGSSSSSAVTPTVSWQASIEHGVQLLRSIWTWLVFGVLLSALIELVITPDDLAFLQQFGTVGTAAMALAVSVPLYVCATASVPIAAALVANGLPLSAALIFLMAGPATNIATIGTIRKEFGMQATLAYLGTVIVGSTLLGIGFDFLLTTSVSEHAHAHGTAWWSTTSVVVLLASFLYFAYERILDWRNGKAPQGEGEELMGVDGLNCNSCVRKLEQALGESPSVQLAKVSLEHNNVRIQSTLSRYEIVKIIEKAGFKAR